MRYLKAAGIKEGIKDIFDVEVDNPDFEIPLPNDIIEISNA